MHNTATWQVSDVIAGSLIIISVACGESLPIVVERLHTWKQDWQPIIVSTLLMLFLAELLPQYIIPKHPMQSVYNGRYCIWAAMFLTSPVSYSIAWFLDYVSGRDEKWPLFNIDQLAYVLQYHERSEKKGGLLCQDTIRVVINALRQDSCRINGDHMSADYKAPCEKDLEKVGSGRSFEIITNWYKVNYVDIDEVINESFVQKIKRWSITEIPVISKDTSTIAVARRCYGLLHIKVFAKYKSCISNTLTLC